MTDGLMSPEQRLWALNEIELQQQRKQRRVVRAVWTAIAVGALALGSIVAFASWQLTTVRREIKALSDQKKGLQAEVTELERQKGLVEGQLRAAKGVLKGVPEAQLNKAVDKQFAAAPGTAALLPRIYVHTVDAADYNTRAEGIRTELQNAGYFVLGIENVARAKGLRTTDVRFYHKADRGEAEKIALTLKNAGEPSVNLNYLEQYENRTDPRPNHFEVWLAHRAE